MKKVSLLTLGLLVLGNVANAKPSYKEVRASLIEQAKIVKNICGTQMLEDLEKISEVAGISTASSVGSAALAGGALVAGLEKEKALEKADALEDEVFEEYKKEMEILEEIKNDTEILSDNTSSLYYDYKLKKLYADYKKFSDRLDENENENEETRYDRWKQAKEKYPEEYEKFNDYLDLAKEQDYKWEESKNITNSLADKSDTMRIHGFYEGVAEGKADVEKENAKKLGNLRTGLIGAAAGTSGISTALSAVNISKSKDITKLTDECKTEIHKFRNETQKIAELEENEDTLALSGKVQDFASDCKGYEEKLATTVKGLSIGGTIASGVGTLSGIAGTVTSVIANKQPTDIIDAIDEKYDGRREKKRKLDKTSNILAGVTAGTSLATTGLSVAQIETIKDAIEQAKRCSSASLDF